MNHFAVMVALSISLGIVHPVLAQSPEEQIAAASALFEAKKYAEAATRLDAFLTTNPKHAKAGAAAFVLGRSRTELKQWDKAAAAYEKAIASQDDSVEANSLLGLGEAALQLKHHERAINALEGAVRHQLSKEQAGTAYLWIGQCAAELERWQSAETAFQRVLKDFGTTDLAEEALYGLGVVAQKTNKGDLARRRFQTLLQNFRTGQMRHYARFALAEMDLDEKRLPQAKVGYEAILNDPAAAKDAPQVLAAAEDGLVRMLLESGDTDTAAPRLESILRRLPPGDPQRFRAQLSLGHCRYRQKQYPAAGAAYAEASKSTDAAVAADAMYWAGNSSLAAEQYTEAAGQFSRFAQRFPSHDLAPKAQMRAGDALAAAKQTDGASAAYRAVIAKYPASPQATEAKSALQGLVNAIEDPAKLAAAIKSAPAADQPALTLRLARILLAQRKFAAAGPYLRDLLKGKLDPAAAGEAQYLLGLSLDGQDLTSPAVAAWTEAVKLAPAAAWSGDAQVRLAWSLIESKQPAKAEAAAQAALQGKLDADLTDQARLALLQATLDQQKWDAVTLAAKAVVDAKPTPENLGTALFALAISAEKLGKPEEGLPYWERIAAELPKSSYVPQALLKTGDARLKAGDNEAAKANYERVVKEYPTSAGVWEARFKLGSALYGANSYAEALAQFDAVAESKTAGPYQPEALYWSGVAADKAGNKEGAIQRLSKLVMQYPTHMRVANAKIRLAALKAVP